MPSAPPRDRRVHGVDHLGHVGVLRAGPLVRAAEQLAGVLGAVLRRHEERVGRHVVDQHELRLAALAEDAAAARLGRGRGRRLRGLRAARATRREHGGRDAGGAARERRATGHRPPARRGRVVTDLCFGPFEPFKSVVDGIQVRHE